jgi:hypothetical protein
VVLGTIHARDVCVLSFPGGCRRVPHFVAPVVLWLRWFRESGRSEAVAKIAATGFTPSQFVNTARHGSPRPHASRCVSSVFNATPPLLLLRDIQVTDSSLGSGVIPHSALPCPSADRMSIAGVFRPRSSV